jgi:membrane associated rhomboid family serine protease
MAFFQDPNQRQPFLRVPAVVLFLIAALIGVYLMQIYVIAPPGSGIVDEYAFIPALYSRHFMSAHYLPPKSFFNLAIRFVSYIFLHGSWTHLMINGVWLLPFVAIVARRFGALLFLVFFLICGAAAAAAFLASKWGVAEPVIGASGAIAGLMAAGFRLIDYPYSPGTRPGAMAPLLSPQVLLWTALTVAIFVVFGITGFGTGPGPQVIAWQAHIGGFFAGLLLAGPFMALRHRMVGQVELADPPA